jgi:AraC-like DNA-binding protein
VYHDRQQHNKYARDGYWVQLDGMLEQYAPDLLELIPQGIWDCAKTNGYDGMGIYAVPGLKIGDISEMVGYADTAHFARTFKKLENMSANEYRNSLRR